MPDSCVARATIVRSTVWKIKVELISLTDLAERLEFAHGTAQGLSTGLGVP